MYPISEWFDFLGTAFTDTTIEGYYKNAGQRTSIILRMIITDTDDDDADHFLKFCYIKLMKQLTRWKLP